jgi:WD40 repeat protein
VRRIANPISVGSWATEGVIPDHVQVSHDGGRALAWSLAHATVFDLATGAKLAQLPGSAAGLLSLSWLTADGRSVVQLRRGDGHAAVHDAATGRVVRDISLSDVADLAISPDGERVIATFRALRGPTLIRISTGAELAVPGVDDGALHARFDATGRHAAFYGLHEAIVVDLDRGATVATLHQPGNGRIDDARFDAGARRLATWADDRSAALWDIATGRVLVSAEAVTRQGIAVSADGERFATGSVDGSIRIWDAATARLLEVIHGDGEVAGLAWSDDGMRLVAQSGSNQFASIWDVHLERRSSAEIARLSTRWKVVGGLLQRQ